MKTPNMLDAKKRNQNDIKYVKYNKEFDKFGNGKKFFVRTYGCQMNEHDSEKIKGMLKSVDFSEGTSVDDADIVILNTCAIRENAHDKVFGFLGVLKHLKQSKPDLLIGLCGCMAQEEVVVNDILNKYKYVDFVCGTHNLDNMLSIIKNKIDTDKRQIEVLSYEGDVVEGVPVVRDSKYSAWIDIIYGCDKFCTYCIVPYTRGTQRSRKHEDIVEEVKKLVNDGYKEVTLLGQNVNAYGKDLYKDYDLSNLLSDVSDTGIERIRFVTSHPWDFTDKMIDVIASRDNIMPYIHLPLQSGSNKILKLMNRKYTSEEYLKLYNSIREKVADSSVTTDIIVGFPGETEEEFGHLYNFVKDVKFDRMGAFEYSREKGTYSDTLKGHLSEKIKKERRNKLMELQQKISLENNEKYIDKTIKCIVEGYTDDGVIIMRSEHDAPEIDGLVYATSNREVIPGDIEAVKITKADEYDLFGEIIE